MYMCMYRYVCMYVCVYVYTCVYIYIYVHADSYDVKICRKGEVEGFIMFRCLTWCSGVFVRTRLLWIERDSRPATLKPSSSTPPTPADNHRDMTYINE